MSDLQALTSEIVTAYVGSHNVSIADLAGVISSVHSALKQLSEPALPAPLTPVVPINRSIKPDYIICLEDGRRFKSLKRHLQTTYGLSPDEYRQKWGLRADYPMVAPNYAAQRSELAKSIGLGRRKAEAAPPPAPAKPGRKRAAPAAAAEPAKPGRKPRAKAAATA
jgi:predicted transcriptional regulator